MRQQTTANRRPGQGAPHRAILTKLRLLFVTVIVAACKGGGDGGGTAPPPPPTPTISIALAQSALSVQQGGQGGVQVTVTGAGGFSGTPSLSIEGVPTGVTGTVSSPSTSGSTTTATVTIAASRSASVGNATITVRATGSGVAAVSATLALTVTQAPALALTLSAANVTVVRGKGGTVALQLARTNLTVPVALSVEGAPTGVTATFDPSPAPADASTLTLAVAASVAAGNVPLVVRATAAGVDPVTQPLRLDVVDPAAIAVAPAAATLSIEQGASGTNAITLTRTNYAGAVALSLEGSPAGVTATFTPPSTTGTSSFLSLAVGTGVAAGTYALTMRATGDSVAATAPISLTVTPRVVGSYTLEVNPSQSVTVAQGGGVAIPIRVRPSGGLVGVPAITVSANTPGLTATVGADSAQGALVTALTITASAGVAPGTYPLTIRGTFPSLGDVTLNYQVQVVVPNVSLDFPGSCGTGTPLWLAIQDGEPSTPWVRVLQVSGRYVARFSAPRGGLAFVTTGFFGSRSTIVQYGTNAELTAMAGDVLCGNPTLPTRSATASTTGLAGSENALVSFGAAVRVFSSGLPGGTLTGILPGPHDLVARNSVLPGGFHPNDRIIIRRDLDPPAGGSLGAALNFTSGEAFAPDTASITVAGLLPGEVINSGGVQYYTRSACTRSALWGVSPAVGATKFPARGVPLARQRASDYHGITYSAGLTGQQFRQVNEYTRAFGARTVALGSAIPAPTLTILPSTVLRLRIQVTLPADLNGPLDFTLGGNNGRPTFVTASAAWRGGSVVDVSIPDFAQLSGYSNSWGLLPSPGTISWTITGSGASGGRCTEGGREVVANRSGVVP